MSHHSPHLLLAGKTTAISHESPLTAPVPRRYNNRHIAWVTTHRTCSSQVQQPPYRMSHHSPHLLLADKNLLLCRSRHTATPPLPLIPLPRQFRYPANFATSPIPLHRQFYYPATPLLRQFRYSANSATPPIPLLRQFRYSYFPSKSSIASSLHNNCWHIHKISTPVHLIRLCSHSTNHFISFRQFSWVFQPKVKSQHHIAKQ